MFIYFHGVSELCINKMISTPPFSHLSLCNPPPHSNNMTMTFEEPDPLPPTDHILDWLEETVFSFPSFFDDPYSSITELSEFQWWDEQEQQGLFINSPLLSPKAATTTISTSTSTTTSLTDLPSPNNDSLKKRKSLNDENPSPQAPCTNRNRNHRRRCSTESTAVLEVRRPVVRAAARKPTSKSTGNNTSKCNNSKEGRWAEQLLNPCALAITSGNLSRVQHLLYVLQELASSSGDANQRLASHGLRALTHYLSSNSSPSLSCSTTLPFTFSSTEPRLFQRSLLKFYEVNPWFTFANTIANASILQILAQQQSDSTSSSRELHILDIGVSHGIQWPTLLEALSRRSGGPPPLVRITIVGSTSSSGGGAGGGSPPFSTGPPGDDFSTRLLRFAKSINLNLQIDHISNQDLQTLNPQTLNSSSDNETLIVCTQFRLHSLNHKTPDDRSEFLRRLASLNPSAVILSENDSECSCNQCGDFGKGFSRRVEYLWRFLDSTSSAFKGRECEERRMMEGEAARVLMSHHEGGGGGGGGRERWCEDMTRVGFVKLGFGEDAIDGGRALLRKYDSNWEMREDEEQGCVCLSWKAQPVSFCSFWKLQQMMEKVD